MKTFPMFLQMAGRRVVIAGSGEQAAQKVRLFARTEARIVLLCDLTHGTLEDELATQAQAGVIEVQDGPIAPADFAGAALAVIGSGCPGIDASLHALAQEARVVTNVVDQPWLCDAITPSIVDRDPVVVAIGTEGTAPVLGRQIKTRVEEMLEPRLGALAALVGTLRDRVAMRLQPRKRRDFYRWIFTGTPRQAVVADDLDAARTAIEAALESGDWSTDVEALTVVEATPGATDLIALRAVQRLQEADVVYVADAVAAYLELARRDAERMAFDPAQDKDIDAVREALAERQRVVCLVPAGVGADLALELNAPLVTAPAD